jgi:predicted membrane protein
MKYKSDLSKFNFFIPLLPVVLVSLIAFLSGDSIKMVLEPIGILFLFLSVLITVAFFTTYYEIQENVLLVSMFFYKTKIKISEIRTIKYSNSIMKTNFYKPGFHHKGIEIIYHKYDDIFISPEKREQFIAKLLEINPNITIKN